MGRFAIDWRQVLITFNPNFKEYSDYDIPLTNDLSTSTTCAAVVGNCRTLSLLAYVHIALMKSPHSLISSRDEVSKEIRNARKDRSMNSLHLFHGNVELLPLSYCDCTEEFWDEEEYPAEIKTVMKVFTSVYHSYFNGLLTKFLNKDSPFPLHEESLSQFHQLKDSFTTAPIIPKIHPSLPNITSNHAFGFVLVELTDSGKHPIVLDRHKHIQEELNSIIN
ncbi:hypothetical protein O181_017808 [Austropuccinia psidii MF-1]|uniref:Uncharacterized protein n=1 Tax=Austropuccinia psidii MF-1 TaxID=1389203 RepID=A0A9Q3C7T8_9BASI|nr:hypothetical protein [Austropuccinia psidii MF-1]